MEGQHPEFNLKKSDLFEELKLQCPFFEPAFLYCCEQNCNSNAVVCIKPDCKCKLVHDNCASFLSAAKINKQINNKIINYSPNDFKQIETKAEQIIDKVSQMMDKMNINFKTFGLNENQESIKDSLINHFTQSSDTSPELTGQKLYKLRTEQKSADKEWFDYSIKKYTNLVKQTKRAIEPLFNQIEDKLTYMHSFYAREHSLNNYLSNSAIDRLIPNFLLFKQNLIEIISQNFDAKEIIAIRKVYTYTYSKEQFHAPQIANNLFPGQSQQILQSEEEQKRLMKEQRSLSNQFVEALKGKSNLIFLIYNANNVRYGVYTPFLIDEKNQWKNDIQKSSFLFKVDSIFSQKLCEPQKGLKFTSQNVEIGNIRLPTLVKNGFSLSLKNGRFVSEILFSKNPVGQNNNQNFAIFSNRNTNPLQVAESPVSILEVYQLRLKKNNL